MFTGIIEELGKVQRITRGSKEQRLVINCKKILEDMHIGDSIAVNGVCLTVVEFNINSFSADVMNETFSRSGLGELTLGSVVNLERAMAANGRFGGHIVSGHIDGTGKIKSVRQDGNAVWFEISVDSKILRGIVEKGSIAIDGISLTVAAVGRDSFKVSIIPHTLKVTVLGSKRVGDRVNLENDVIGKYISKFLGREEKCEESRLKELLMI
ncbi:riboflavin synthase, alpha subunit [Butyrivibrio fibrisolvens 16/4]|nr:riboflavin synthase, alpha subunit [Butyrivibrio fibrisolvens 16/4]